MRRFWRFATFATLLGVRGVRGVRGDWLLEQNPSCWTEPWALGALGALAVARHYQAYHIGSIDGCFFGKSTQTWKI